MCVHTKSGNTSSSGGDVLTCSDLHSRWWSIWGGPSYKEHKNMQAQQVKSCHICMYKYHIHTIIHET